MHLPLCILDNLLKIWRSQWLITRLSKTTYSGLKIKPKSMGADEYFCSLLLRNRKKTSIFRQISMPIREVIVEQNTHVIKPWTINSFHQNFLTPIFSQKVSCHNVKMLPVNLRHTLYWVILGNWVRLKVAVPLRQSCDFVFKSALYWFKTTAIINYCKFITNRICLVTSDWMKFTHYFLLGS